MKKKLEDAKRLWVKDLLYILWVLRTTPNTATKQSSFTLAFEEDTVTLVEVGHNTLGVSKYNEKGNTEGFPMNLDLIEEVKNEASTNAIAKRK